MQHNPVLDLLLLFHPTASTTVPSAGEATGRRRSTYLGQNGNLGSCGWFCECCRAVRFEHHLLSPFLLNNALSQTGFRSEKGGVGTGLRDPLSWHCDGECALKRSWGRGQSMGEAEQGTVVQDPFQYKK